METITFPLDNVEQVLVAINTFFGNLLHAGSSGTSALSADLGVI